MDSPVIADVRDKFAEFQDEFSISEVACSLTEGMGDWWDQVDRALLAGKRVQLRMIVINGPPRQPTEQNQT